MSLFVFDSFTNPNADSVSLLDHGGETGAVWSPKPEYDGTIRVLGAASQYVYSNPLDGREAMYVASGGPAPSSWQLKASYIAAGGVSGCGETLSKGSATITAAGVGATATLTVTASGGVFGSNIYTYDVSSNYALFLDTGVNSSGNTTTDAAAFAASINTRTSAHGFSATSSGPNVIVTAPGGAWPNGWLLQGSSGSGGAVMTFTNGSFSGGTNGSISSLTVNGVNIIPSGVTLTASITSAAYSAGGVYYSAVIAQYATALSNAINAQTSSPDYSANTTANVVNIIAAAGSGATPNGFVVASTVTNVTRSHANMGGGGGYVNPDNRLAVCWCVQPDKKSFYRLREVGVGSALWAIERVDNGVITQLATTATPSLPNGAECPVVVLYASGRMTVSFRPLNVQSSVSYTDASPLPNGYFGIWGSGGGTTVGSFPNQVPQKGIYLLGLNVPFVAGTSDAAINNPERTLVMAGAANTTITALSGAGGAVMSGTSPVVTVYAVPPSGGISMGGSATLVFAIVTVYRISDEGEPSGGVNMGGGAIIQEAIPWVPAGGVVMSGSANVPFLATGGTVMSGNAVPTTLYAIPVGGGCIAAGSAAVVFASIFVPSGGSVMGGAAVIRDYQAFFLPSGGSVMGGAALAYMVRSYITVTTENPYGDLFPGWAMNMETNAPSRYMNLPANSITRFKGRTFVSNAGGIYEMGADNDAGQPIHASVEFATTDFGNGFEKRMEKAYIGVRTQGSMKLKVMVKGQTPQYYVIVPSLTDVKGTQVPIGKGLVGRYWGSRLDNVAGADFELESIEFNPVRGQRHGA